MRVGGRGAGVGIGERGGAGVSGRGRGGQRGSDRHRLRVPGGPSGRGGGDVSVCPPDRAGAGTPRWARGGMGKVGGPPVLGAQGWRGAAAEDGPGQRAQRRDGDTRNVGDG